MAQPPATGSSPAWPGADSPALLLNQRGGRLSDRGAHDILLAIAEEAGITADFTGGHVLRHTFGTRLVREGHDIVLVAAGEYPRAGPADAGRPYSAAHSWAS